MTSSEIQKNDPKIRIVIPTYNRAQLVVRAVESARSQDYPNFEIIVVDDGSTDGTTAPSGCVFLQRENGGVSSARNAAISHPGEFDLIAFLDADDVWTDSSHLSKAVAMDIALFFTPYNVVGHSDKFIDTEMPLRESRLAWMKDNSKNNVLRSDVAFYGMLTGDVAPKTSTVVIDKRKIQFPVIFDECMMVFEDISLYTRIARECDIAFKPENQVDIHIYGDNLTTQLGLDSPLTERKYNDQRLHAEQMLAISKTRDERSVCHTALSHYWYMLGQCADERGENPFNYYRKSLAAKPSLPALKSFMKCFVLNVVKPRR